MANAKVLRKAQLLRLMVDELCLHTYGSLGYGLEGRQGKTQIQNDIRRCRRTLLDLWKLIGKEL